MMDIMVEPVPSNDWDDRVSPNAPQLKRFLSVNGSELMLCRHPAGAENYILLFIIPTLTRLRKAYAMAGAWGYNMSPSARAE